MEHTWVEVADGGRNFLSGLMALPLFRSTFWPICGDEVFNGLNAQTYMTDREEAGLRGLVKTCVEETGTILRTTEYDLDGRLLTTRYSDATISDWVTAKTYDADGRLVKTFFGQESSGPATEVLYEYDEGGRLKEIRDENGNQISYRYDQQGRKTEVRRFAPEVSAANRRSTVEARDFWVPPDIRQGVPTGGSVTTLFDERDLPIELQLLDSGNRVASRFVRTYDGNGRIMEENQIQENPALLTLSKCTGEAREKFEKLDDKQLEEINNTWKVILRGKNGTGKSFAYDSQGRVTEMRDRNWGSDTATATSYNEQGDISEIRKTISSNLAPCLYDALREDLKALSLARQ